MRFRKKREAIIEEENKRRASIIAEFEEEKEAKNIELKEMLELKKLKKKKKKKLFQREPINPTSNSIITTENSTSSDSDEQSERIVIDIKERVQQTKKKLLPIDSIGSTEEIVAATTDISGNE